MEEKYVSDKTYSCGDPVPETDASKRIREGVKRGFKSQAFAAHYGTKYRLNADTLQWYPAEPEYSVLNEPDAYWTRLLGEPVKRAKIDFLRPDFVEAEGVNGTRCYINITLRTCQIEKPEKAAGPADARVTDPTPAPNPGAENWEKVFGEMLSAERRIVNNLTQNREPSVAELFDQLSTAVDKKMIGLRGLLYEADRQEDGARKEAMLAIVKEAIRTTLRRVANTYTT